MKMNYLTSSWLNHEAQTIATFGRARLIKRYNGSYELMGGSKEDRLQAGEWISMFMHEAVVTSDLDPVSRPTSLPPTQAGPRSARSLGLRTFGSAVKNPPATEPHAD